MRDVSGPSKSLAGYNAGPLPAAASDAIALDPKNLTYYSATASDFLLASPLLLLAIKEKSNEGIISAWLGFTCRKPRPHATSPR